MPSSRRVVFFPLKWCCELKRRARCRAHAPPFLFFLRLLNNLITQKAVYYRWHGSLSVCFSSIAAAEQANTIWRYGEKGVIENDRKKELMRCTQHRRPLFAIDFHAAPHFTACWLWLHNLRFSSFIFLSSSTRSDTTEFSLFVKRARDEEKPFFHLLHPSVEFIMDFPSQFASFFPLPSSPSS